MDPEKPPYTVFSNRIPTFDGRPTSLTLKLPCKNPKKVKAILKKTWEAFLNTIFLIHKKSPLLIKAPYKTIVFWTQISQPQKEKLWSHGKWTGVPEIWAHNVKC